MNTAKFSSMFGLRLFLIFNQRLGMTLLRIQAL